MHIKSMCYLVKKEEKLVGFLDLRKVYRPRLIYSHQVYKKKHVLADIKGFTSVFGS